MKNFSRTVFRNSAFGFAANMAMKVLSFAFSVFVIRRLGGEDFGQFAAVGAIGSIFLFLSDLGLSVYAVREVAQLRDKPDGHDKIEILFSNMISLRLLLALLTALVTLLFAWFTSRPEIMLLAIAINCITVVLYAVQGSSAAFLAGYEQFGVTSRAQVINQLIYVVLGGLSLWLGLGLIGLVLATLIGVCVFTALCWFAVRKQNIRWRKPTPEIWLQLIKFSIPFGILTFALGLSYKFDTVLLDLYRSKAETGWYNTAYNLVFSCVMLSNVINTALYPSLSRQSVVGAQTLPAIYERVMRYLLMLALPLAIAISILSPDIVRFLYSRPDVLPATPALQILIWVVPFMYASEFLGYIVLISGQEKKVARSVVISTAFNIAINLFVVPRFGYLGAAVLTVLTEIILVGQYTFILHQQLRKFDWSATLIRPLVAALGMGTVLLISQNVWLPLHALMGGAVYVALLLALRVVGKDELSFVRSLRRAEPASA